MRQLGVGSERGAGALAIFHQLLFDEWTSGTLVTPLAGIEVDAKWYGMIEWSAVRNPASFLDFKLNNMARYSEFKTFSPDMPSRKTEWYTEDGDIQCHPILVLSYLQAFDTANVKIGAERSPQNTEIMHKVPDLDAAPLEWTIKEVRPLASVTTAARRSITLGVAVGPRQYVADQLLAKADVIRVRERVQLCQDPQTEFALLRESLGVSRTCTSSECTVRQVFKREAAKSLKLGRGHSRDSFQDVQRTIWNKPRSVLASKVLGARGAGRCQPSTPRSTHCSQTSDSGHDLRCSHSRTHTEKTFAGASGRFN